MIQKIGQGKPWRWVVISAGVVLGGYLLISLLGAILGLAFAAGTLLGGAWLFQRIWNQWNQWGWSQRSLCSGDWRRIERRRGARAYRGGRRDGTR